MSDRPAWMDAGSSESAARDVESSSGAVAKNPNDPPHVRKVRFAFFLMNAGLMVFLAAVGALGIGSANNINDTGLIFVGLYLIVFAGLVFFYEIAQVTNWERLDGFMKRNFGFLYGVNGKSLFEIMVGILCFGLQSPRSLAIACGVIVSAWGVAQILIYMKFPEYFEPETRKYKYIIAHIDDVDPYAPIPQDVREGAYGKASKAAGKGDKTSLLSSAW